MRWSPVKEEVFRFEGNIVVSAGAGSGKTAALVELYLRLLAGETALGRPLAVEEIVAITFTDKAAVEMKERVRREMGRRLRAGDRSVDWKRASRSLPTAPIATFHSFCSRLLRENPAEAGVDPSFTLMDESTASAELRTALDELLAEEIAECTPDVRLLLRHFPLAGAGRGKGLGEYLLMLCRRGATDAPGEDEHGRREESWREAATRLFTGHVAGLGELLAEVERILGGKELAFHARLRELPAICRQSPLTIDDPASLRLLCAMEACIGGNWGREREIKERLEECLTGLQLACRQVQSVPFVAALRRLAVRAGEAYRLRKERRGALDFDDLLTRCHALLARDAELCSELQRRFAVIMVDEFQDTNPLQKRLVELLCGPAQRLFIVGDPKQSIYLFRGADVTVFTATQAEVAAAAGKNLYFQESFRSREGIITFVNRLFSRIMTGAGSPFEVGYRDGDHLQPQRRDWDGSPCVELLTLAEEGGSEELRAREAAAIAAKVARMVDGVDGVQVFDREDAEGESEPRYVPRTPRYGDIAVLFRRFSNLKLFERALRERGIPYYVVKGRGFFRCQEILDICSFLRYLEFGGDLVALTALLRSPLCGVSDETLYLLAQAEGGLREWERLVQRRWRREEDAALGDLVDPADRERLASLAGLLGRLRPLRDRLTLAELLEEVLTGTDVASVLLTTFQGGQKVANLRKLVELSRSFSVPAEGALRRFISFLVELTTSEPTEAEAVIAAEGGNVVRLMTVHQSKGLEFPIVILPELGAGLPGDNSAVHHDERLGLGMKLPLPGGSWGTTLAVAEITALRREKEAAELKRLFYVALTRARDYLVLSGEGRGEWRRWIDAFRDSEDGNLLRVSAVLPGGEEGEDAVVPERPSPLPLAPEEITAAVDRAILHVPPLPNSMLFSPTALEDFRHCPRKYFYKGVLGLDEGLFADLLGHPERQGRRRQGMSSLEKGTLAHAMLERLDFGADPREQRLLCARVARHAAGAGADDVAEVSGAVMAFAASPLGRELAQCQLFREYPFLLRLTGRATCYLKGAIDLVAVDDDRVTVYDYKYLAREGADLEGYRFQLRTYMLALAKVWPGKKVRGQLLFLKGGGAEEVSCDVGPFEEELIGLMDAVREKRGGEDFSLRSGCDGGHCPFRQRCGRK